MMSPIAWMWRQCNAGIARTVVIEYEQDGQLCLLRCAFAPGKAVRDCGGRILARAIIHREEAEYPYCGEMHRDPQAIIEAMADISLSSLSKEMSGITLIFYNPDAGAIELVRIEMCVIFAG